MIRAVWVPLLAGKETKFKKISETRKKEQVLNQGKEFSESPIDVRKQEIKRERKPTALRWNRSQANLV